MIIELNIEEVTIVTGGSIVRELEERFPFGEWVGNSFFPNGRPQPQPDWRPVPF